MKTSIYSKKFTGYGHYKITIEYSDGKLYSATTTDMPTFDSAFNSDPVTKKQWAEKNRAEKQLIRYVKRENNLK
jgi:hypothetical protein